MSSRNRLTGLFVEMCKKFFDFELTHVQVEMADAIIKRTLERRRHTFALSLCRQVGKTELMVKLEWFLAMTFPEIEKEPYLLATVAPEKRTGSILFDRLKKTFEEYERVTGHKVIHQSDDKRMTLKNGSQIEVYGIFKTFAEKKGKKSTKEGRTFHKILRDEMHIGDDEVYRDELLPTLATTGGVDVFIGNGGFRQCMGKELCDGGSSDSVTLFKRDYEYMREAMMSEYERTGEKRWLRWVEAQDAYINQEGLHSEFVRKNLFCEWMVERGNFVVPALLYEMRRGEVEYFETTQCDIGVDFGKSSDRTVVTITDHQNNVREWGVFRGDYSEQVEEITGWLKQKQPSAVLGQALRYNTMYADSTGAGDVVVEMLKKVLRGSGVKVTVKGVVFSPKTKDRLARRALMAMSAEGSQRFSYPSDHEHTRFFEREMVDLEKEIRQESELLNYKHPDRSDAHDDFVDSTFLSLYGNNKVNKGRVFAERAF